MLIKPTVFRVYDTETTGLSPAYDQVIQFAGVAVDEDLMLIPGDEILIDIKLRPDVVPSPFAFAVHGISINRLKQFGVSEMEAAGLISDWFMATPDSMITGYNSLSFDDEVMRNVFYRSQIKPYAHEFSNGNSRMDIFRLVMFVYALRPDSINFPVNDEGKVSLKLGDICAANGIELKHAHDARFDVLATIAIMRLIKDKNPRIWDYYLKLTNKDFNKSLAEQQKPVVLVDRYLPREQGHTTLALPIIYDSRNKQKMLCFDLRHNPSVIMSLPAEEIRRRIFSQSDSLKPGEAITCIRDITVNKQPLIADPNVLGGHPSVMRRTGLDMDQCMMHYEMIKGNQEFRAVLQNAFKGDFEPCADVYDGIYSLGFMSREEENLRGRLRYPAMINGDEQPFPAIVTADPFALSRSQVKDGMRMLELTLRAKWGNYGDVVEKTNTYTEAELHAWNDHLQAQWDGEPKTRGSINLDGYKQALLEVNANTALNAQQVKALEELAVHIEDMKSYRDHIQALCTPQKAPEVSDDTPEAPVESSSDAPQDDLASMPDEVMAKKRKGRELSPGPGQG